MPDIFNASEWDLTQPQRQSVLGVVVYILRNVRALFAVALSIFAVGAANPNIFFYFSLALVPLGIFLLVLAYYQFKNFTFQVNGDKLIIHKGVFIKDKIVVEADRIQSINITQNFVQRIIGLVSLKVDTAGSKGNELEVPALERVKADALKKLLYDKKQELVQEESSDESTHVSDSKVNGDDQLLVHLGIPDLLLVGLTENHLRTGLVALAFVFGTFSQYQDYIAEYFDDSIETYAEQAVNAGLVALFTFLITYAIFSVVLSMVRTILQFFSLKAVLRNNAVEISTGLIKRNEYRVPVNKVQFIQWESNPLRRAVGFESARLKPSNSIGEVARQQRIEIPALKKGQSDLLSEGVFRNFNLPDKQIEGNPWAYARFNAIVMSILIIPVASILAYVLTPKFLFTLLIIPLIAVFGYFFGKTVRLFYDGSFIVIQKGLVFTKRIILPTYKIQSIKKRSNIFLRRRSLGHVDLYTAAGTRSVRYLDQNGLSEFYDFAIFSVENSTESWM